MLVEAHYFVDSELAGQDCLKDVIPPPVRNVVGEDVHTVHQIHGGFDFFLRNQSLRRKCKILEIGAEWHGDYFV